MVLKMYLFYVVPSVSAKVQLENINMILTSTSCIHLQKDDSLLEYISTKGTVTLLIFSTLSKINFPTFTGENLK
jgi:hypothetical protein